MPEARSDQRSGVGVAAFGVLAIIAGSIVLLALIHVHPSLRWAWRHQQPMWVIGLGAAWITGGIGLIVLRRRPVASAVLLGALAMSAPLALGAEVDRSNLAYTFSDYRFWWLGDRWTLAWLDLACLGAASLAGWQVGCLLPRPRHTWIARIVAVLLALLAAALTAIAVVAFGLIGVAGEERTQIPLYVRQALLAQAGLAVAAAAVVRAFARRPPRSLGPQARD